MVEDMEECVLCAFRRHPLLDIIDDEQVDGLVEADEIVDSVLAYRIGILYLKETSADIEHTFFREQLLCLYTYRIDEVRLSASRRTEDEHRVELCGMGISRDIESDGTRQFVTHALDEVIERLVRVELRVELL